MLCSICRNNLDYVVDRICMQLRARPSTSAYSYAQHSAVSGSGVNTSTHLIVDLVFRVIGTTVEEGSVGSAVGSASTSTSLSKQSEVAEVAPMVLLRDVICDALENIDAFSINSTYYSTAKSATSTGMQSCTSTHCVRVYQLRCRYQ